MASFKFIPLLVFFFKSIISNPNEPCTIPDESLSKLQTSLNCPIINNRIQHGQKCEFNCNRNKTVLRCIDGRYIDSESVPININTFCNPNCKLPSLPLHTRISENCYKWNFADQRCIIFCPYLVELAEFICEKGQISKLWSIDEVFTTYPIPLEIPSACPDIECFENTPKLYGDMKSIEFVNSTTAFYSCLRGSKFNSNAEVLPNGKGVLHCSEGIWTVQQCVSITTNLNVCGALPSSHIEGFDNFECVQNPTDSQQCKYNCLRGYKAEDSNNTFSFINCTDTGWTVPLCIPAVRSPKIYSVDLMSDIVTGVILYPNVPKCSLPLMDNNVKSSEECIHPTVENGITCYLSCVSGVFNGSDLDEIVADCVKGYFHSDDIVTAKLITNKHLSCREENPKQNSPLPTRFCRKLDSVVNGTFQSDCAPDKRQKSGEKCVLKCPEKKFEGLNCNTVRVLCEGEKWMRLFLPHGHKEFVKEHVNTLICGKKRPSLQNSKTRQTVSCTPRSVRGKRKAIPLKEISKTSLSEEVVAVAKKSVEERDERNHTDHTNYRDVLDIFCIKGFVSYTTLFMIS